jgi:hypothetical protein
MDAIRPRLVKVLNSEISAHDAGKLPGLGELPKTVEKPSNTLRLKDLPEMKDIKTRLKML